MIRIWQNVKNLMQLQRSGQKICLTEHQQEANFINSWGKISIYTLGYIFIVTNSFFYLMCSLRGGSWASKTLKLSGFIDKQTEIGTYQPQDVCKHTSELLHGLLRHKHYWWEADNGQYCTAIYCLNGQSSDMSQNLKVYCEPCLIYHVLEWQQKVRLQILSVKIKLCTWHSRAIFFSDVSVFPHLLTRHGSLMSCQDEATTVLCLPVFNSRVSPFLHFTKCRHIAHGLGNLQKPVLFPYLPLCGLL